MCRLCFGVVIVNILLVCICYLCVVSVSICGWLLVGNGSYRFNFFIGNGVGMLCMCSSFCSDCRCCWYCLFVEVIFVCCGVDVSIDVVVFCSR